MRTTIFLLALIVPVQTFATGAPDGGAQMYSVGSERANIRSGPGAEHEVAWEAGRYYPLEALDREGSWVRVGDYENEEGWIHKSLLAKVPAVVIITKKANIREGAGRDYEVAWTADKDCSLKVLEAQDGWYKVSDGEEELGWLHSSVTWGYADSDAGAGQLEEQDAGL